MKRCPTCGLSLDDSQTFCTNDGTPLVADEQSYDPQATMIIPPGSVPTVPPPSPPPQSPQTGWQAPARPTTPPAPAYASQPMGYGQSGATPGAQPQPGKFGPALIGGAVTGILSLFAGFLPSNGFVIFSFFCIVWALIGGAIASMLYIKRAPNPVRTGEGAILGLIAGVIGALIYLALDTPVAYAIHGEYIQMVANQQPDKISAGAFFALSGLAGAFTITGFSILGGLIGVPMFEKRRGIHTGTPPSPPPGYGQPPGGGYR